MITPLCFNAFRVIVIITFGAMYINIYIISESCEGTPRRRDAKGKDERRAVHAPRERETFIYTKTILFQRRAATGWGVMTLLANEMLPPLHSPAPSPGVYFFHFRACTKQQRRHRPLSFCNSFPESIRRSTTPPSIIIYR